VLDLKRRVGRQRIVTGLALAGVADGRAHESVTPGLLDPFAIGQVGVAIVALTLKRAGPPHPWGHSRLADHRALDNRLHG
jgi:hypothetical protein